MKPAKPWSALFSISRPVRALMAVTLIAVVAVAIVRSRGQEPNMTMLVRQESVPGLLEGDEAFDRREWTAAVEFYRIALELDDSNGGAWSRLGFSLHALQRYAEATEAHRRASQFERFRPVALYNLSCALALQNRRSEAFEALRAAIDARFQHSRPVLNDPDFILFRNDEEFRVLAQLATRPPPSRPLPSRPVPSRPAPSRPALSNSAPGSPATQIPESSLDIALPADWLPPARSQSFAPDTR